MPLNNKINKHQNENPLYMQTPSFLPREVPVVLYILQLLSIDLEYKKKMQQYNSDLKKINNKSTSAWEFKQYTNYYYYYYY